LICLDGRNFEVEGVVVELLEDMTQVDGKNGYVYNVLNNDLTVYLLCIPHLDVCPRLFAPPGCFAP